MARLDSIIDIYNTGRNNRLFRVGFASMKSEQTSEALKQQWNDRTGDAEHMKDSRRKTGIICGSLALAGVSLNYWFAIRRIDYFGAFSGFPNEVSTVQYMIAVMVLIGGLAYSFLVLLRGLEGKFPLVMTVLPFLSVCLYRLDFVGNLFAKILPFVMALIQFTLGFVPSWLWVLIYWILRLFHISGVLHTIIMALLALLLAAIAASAYNVQLHIISKAGRQASTAKDTNQKSRVVASTARSANTSHINWEIYHYEEEEQMTDTVSSSKNSERGLRSMYEERGYFLSGNVWWNGSRQNVPALWICCLKEVIT